MSVNSDRNNFKLQPYFFLLSTKTIYHIDFRNFISLIFSHNHKVNHSLLLTKS
jgi:hypothetical protein